MRALAWPVLFAVSSSLAACCRKPTGPISAQGALALYDGTTDVTGKADDFGSGCPGQPVQRSLRLENVSDVDVRVTSIAITGTGFAGTGLPPTPFTVQAGAAAALPVTFTAQAQGPASGKLTVDGDGSPAEISTSLTGTGQGGASAPSYAATCNYTHGGQPVSRDGCSVLLWDGVLVGSHADDTLVLADDGCPPLQVSQVTIAGADGGAGPFSLPGLPALPLSVTPGSPTTLTLRYTPTSAGSLDTATLTIVTNDPTNTTSPVGTPGTFVYELEGAGLGSTVELSPPIWDFGAVAQGAAATETFQVANTGAIPVTLEAPALANGPPFAIVQGWDAGTVLAPFGADGGVSQLGCVVSFTSPGSGFFQDQLSVGCGSAEGTGSATASLVAHSGGLLCPSPEPLLLPPVSFCGSAVATLTLGNCGNANLTVQAIAFSSGGNPLGTFTATPAQTLPATIAPDGGLDVQVGYGDD
ncbi:MAG: choice-of-anchor D domain-containing protein, partial [Deltaproteobacteria bacterium]